MQQSSIIHSILLKKLLAAGRMKVRSPTSRLVTAFIYCSEQVYCFIFRAMMLTANPCSNISDTIVCNDRKDAVNVPFEAAALHELEVSTRIYWKCNGSSALVRFAYIG